jgi:integrase/recombinase XerC
VGASETVDAVKLLLTRTGGDANGLALAWKRDMTEKKLSANTLNRRLAAIKSLVQMARTVGLVAWTINVRGVRAEKLRDTRGPGRNGVKALLDVAHLQGRTRDVAIMRLLYDLGLRRGEVVSLDVADYDGATLAVLGKGRTGKVKLTIPDPTKWALDIWLEIRGTGDGPLFISLEHNSYGHRLTGQSIYNVVRSLGESVGVNARPHKIRHSAITDALDISGDIRAVARFSRHKDIKVLMIYDDNRADLGGEIASRIAGALGK